MKNEKDHAHEKPVLDRDLGRHTRGHRRLTLASLIVCAAFNSGCAPHPRYIAIPCIAKDQALPAEPERVHDKLTGQADKDLRIVAGSAVRLRSWGEGLQTILNGCRERG